MRRAATLQDSRNTMQPARSATDARMQIAGITYISAAALQKELRISRQTLWRWRQEAKVPAGYRFRNRQILFTAAEVETIREFANRLEPAEAGAGSTRRQLRLFNPVKRGERK